MKLELKHVKGYLGTNLKGIIFYPNSDSETCTLKIKNGFNNECDINDFINGTYQVKPILRPISDLTKEIEVNREKFVPMEELFTLSFGSHSEVNIKDFMGIVSCENCIEKLTLNIKYMCFKTDAMAPDGESDWSPPFNQLKLFEKLYQWHFDIHGLIENNLAIDINTL